MSKQSTYLLVASTQQRPVAGHTHAQHGGIVLGDQLVGAHTLSQVPDPYHTSMITADEFPLVRVDDNVIDRSSVGVIALKTAGTGIPDLHSSILRARDHPLALAVEGNSGDVVGVALESHDRIGVGRLDVKELDIVVASSSEEAFVRGDTQAIDLGVRVLDGTGADARERLPKAIQGTSISTDQKELRLVQRRVEGKGFPSTYRMV